jgi:hypothetical protein
MVEMLALGLVVGTLSGFFGIGGGTILVPALLLLAYDIKTAIGISVVQMVFSSLFGTFLNAKKGTLDIKMTSYIGIGGFIGASFSAILTEHIDAKLLEIIFLSFVSFALVRVYMTTSVQKNVKSVKSVYLLMIGFFIGIFSMTIGVGGSILLVPILVGLFHIPLKNATSAGLFFVVFSSISGFISHSLSGSISYEIGIYIGLASLLGVYLGVYLKEKVEVKLHKTLLTFFYFTLVVYLLQRLILGS